MLSGRAVLVWLPGSRVDSLARTLGRPRDHRNRYLRQVLTNPGIAMKGLQTGQLERRPRAYVQVVGNPTPGQQTGLFRPRAYVQVVAPGPQTGSYEPRAYVQAGFRKVSDKPETVPQTDLIKIPGSLFGCPR